MDRITINLRNPIGKKVRAKAKAAKRTVSDYIGLLVARDIEEGGMLPLSAPLARNILEARRLNIDPEAELSAAISRVQSQTALRDVVGAVAPVTTGKLQLSRV